MEFVSKMMSSVLKMNSFVFKWMEFVSKMMSSVLKMRDFGAEPEPGAVLPTVALL